MFTPGPANHDIESTVDKLKAAVGDSAQAIWDIRAAEEFSGENNRGNSRSGHVPGAVHLEWVDLVNEADHTFKPADDLQALYGGKGIDGSKETIAYCRIGERSSHTWFVLTQLLGHSNVRNYDGSWTEWGGATDTPVVTGP